MQICFGPEKTLVANALFRWKMINVYDRQIAAANWRGQFNIDRVLALADLRLYAQCVVFTNFHAVHDPRNPAKGHVDIENPFSGLAYYRQAMEYSSCAQYVANAIGGERDVYFRNVTLLRAK